MIGLKRGTVQLYPHDPQWETIAVQTIQTLADIFGDIACDIRHVGSTSIRHICAKPIIDIAVAVRDLADVEQVIELMRAHGFHRKDVGHDAQVFFSAGDFERDIRTHHIHVVRHDGMEWRHYLNFTEYLNANVDVAMEYDALKRRLAQDYADNREAYTAGKAEFINYTLRKALVKSYLGQTVTISIDRPIGHVHKKDIVYPINYGYIPGVLGGDGEELDVYLLGVDHPVTEYTARIIAIVHRANDIEDKLVAAPHDLQLNAAQIAAGIHFQEKYYDTHLELIPALATLSCGETLPPPTFDIRPVSADDIPACVALIRAAFATVADEFGITPENAPRFTAFATDAARLTHQHAQGRPMFVMTDAASGETIGYYSLCEQSADTVELNNLCIHPDHRHRKLGQRLLIHALRQAHIRGYLHMTLGIVEENQRLRRWYEMYGFTHTGTQKFDFFPFTCGYMHKSLIPTD